MRRDFNFIYSCELDLPIRVKLVSLYGSLPVSGWKQRLEPPSGCIYAEIKVYSNGRAIGQSVQSSFRQHVPTNSRDIQKWDEWVTLPIKYSELTRDAYLHITVWDVGIDIDPVFVAQCTKRLFSKHGIYRSGLVDIRLEKAGAHSSSTAQDDTVSINTHHPSSEPLASVQTGTRQIVGINSPLDNRHPSIEQEDAVSSNSQAPTAPPPPQRQPPGGVELTELLKLEKMYKQKFIDRVDWLDRITFSRLEEIKQEAKTEDKSLYLTLEFPVVCDNTPSGETKSTGGENREEEGEDIVYSIVFFVEDTNSARDKENLQQGSGRRRSSTSTTATTTTNQDFVGGESGGAESTAFNSGFVDPELGLDNLCELKHHMLTRNARATDIDRRLQPNPSARDALDTILRAPNCQPMSVEERDLVWKFRFWLRANPKALTKFVRSVNWQEEHEVRQAIQVISEWQPIDACDALELLTPQFTHPFIRRYAVTRLYETYINDHRHTKILLYLPQLVQALRYETTEASATTDDDLLIVGGVRICSTPSAANVSQGVEVTSTTGRETPNTSVVNSTPGTAAAAVVLSPSSSLVADYLGQTMDLATFLIKMACENATIANFLFWYLKVEVEANANLNDQTTSQMYSTIIARLKKALANGGTSARLTLGTIAAQKKFVESLVEMSKLVAEVSGSRMKKLEVLKKKLAESQDLMDLKGLSLPLDPNVHVKAVQPDATVLFSSNLMPMRLTFSTVRGMVVPYECSEAYSTIFKRGDDLRQDQLILQMIRLMDSLLKEDKLDLCLTPYAVLAISCNEGFVQYIKATCLADIKNIQENFRMHRPSASGPYGVEPEVIANYVKSCAGYSVICYILGVGDRHLHNLLLQENGRLFHVDFGFILGRDPKPMPPAMKLTSEMINAMGGQNSEHFNTFVNLCATAFCILRRHANLITNLFSLMLDAGIPDIAVERDKAVLKVLERFHLNLSDEEACHLIVRLIADSISAKMPIIVDFVHNVKQFISS